ncbi:MAG: hypothetical protein HPY54_12625 [Chthonomonadetes bacterium]|nr:hypothetical protein [Chthonomonadetes bacterium]
MLQQVRFFILPLRLKIAGNTGQNLLAQVYGVLKPCFSHPATGSCRVVFEATLRLKIAGNTGQNLLAQVKGLLKQASALQREE